MEGADGADGTIPRHIRPLYHLRLHRHPRLHRPPRPPVISANLNTLHP